MLDLILEVVLEAHRMLGLILEVVLEVHRMLDLEGPGAVRNIPAAGLPEKLRSVWQPEARGSDQREEEEEEPAQNQCQKVQTELCMKRTYPC